MKGYLLLATLVALFLAGCAVGPKFPPVPDAAFSARGIETIAVQPIVFRDWGPTTYCERDIENALRFHLLRDLKAKGYQVVRIARAPLPHSGLPDPLADDSPANILSQTPEGADAVLVVWIDHYKQFGLCDAVRFRYLEMSASAILYSLPQGEEIWRNRATVGDYTGTEPVFHVTHHLPWQLLLTLPER
ncbi:hypothetical protein [Geoalkalibacter sp.]|uniref:hypothetical protein n=1 Tax=Geoalkalibacter sp. TaxID=3041440 RepID=UPI00272E2031|nr:hypothetical protein [Geoalkalibacter sp.]